MQTYNIVIIFIGCFVISLASIVFQWPKNQKNLRVKLQAVKID
jgi:hypothetical protein